jgi:hypothetical protein
MHRALPCCRAPPAAAPRATFAPRRRRAPAPAFRPRAAAAAEEGAPEPRLSDSLAALDRLCAAPEQAPDECATAEQPAAPSDEPVVRAVELTLPGDDGAPCPVSVSFRLAGGAASRLLVAPLSLPLGLVFEERGLGCELVEVLPDGSAAAAADAASTVPRLQPGDTLRAVTACVTAMEYSAGNLLGGGVGRPRTRVVVLRVDEAAAWSGASFGRALAGIQSNARAGRRDVTLVLERRPPGDGAGGAADR